MQNKSLEFQKRIAHKTPNKIKQYVLVARLDNIKKMPNYGSDF